MAKKPKKPETEDIVKQAQKHFSESQELTNEQRLKAIDDIDFAFAEDGQWEEELRKKRKSQPCYTYNKIAPAVDRVIGQMRQNRPRIKVVGVEDSDKELAEIYTGLIKNIENCSDADQAYDWAFMYSVTGGYGVFRVHYDYTDATSFDQEIKILKIKNPFAAYYDPAASEYCKGDGRYWFIIEEMSRKEFESAYPNQEAVSFDIADNAFQNSDWLTQDTILVAEYWCKKEVERELVELTDGRVMFADEIEPIADELSAAGVGVKRSRRVVDNKIYWYKIAGNSVLEGPVEWAGRYFPIIPVFGKEVNIAGKDYYRGIVRFAKDAQRGYNLQRSVAIAEVALRPKSPYLVTPKMVEGYANYWEKANTDPIPFLPYNADPESPTGKPYREQAPEVPVAALQLAAIDSDDIKATTNIYDASLGARSNETSGRAIIARQAEGNMATYEFVDNLARSLKYAGSVLVDLIPRIYDTERQVRLLNDDGTTKGAVINQTVIDTQTGQPVVVNDMSRGKFDVVVDVGPSYATQRMEAADSMMAFMQANPAAAGVVSDLIAKNMDWPGADQIAKRLRMLLPPQIQQMESGEGEIPPEAAAQIAAMQQQMQQMAALFEQGAQAAQQMQAELEQTKAELANAKTANEIKAAELRIKEQETTIKGANLILEEQRLKLEKQQQQIDAYLQAAKADTDQINAISGMVEAQTAATSAAAVAAAEAASQPLAQMLQQAVAVMEQTAGKMARPKSAKAIMPDGRVIIMQADAEEEGED